MCRRSGRNSCRSGDPNTLQVVPEAQPETRPECRRRRVTVCGKSCRHSTGFGQTRSSGFSAVTLIIYLRVDAAALPVVRSQPLLEVEEPKRRPRHYSLVQPHPGLPFDSLGQVETELRGTLLI